MLRSKLIFSTILTIVSVCVFGTTINVTAPAYKNQIIRWKKKIDYISNSTHIIDEQKIDKDGNVQLNGDLKDVVLSEISIGRSYGYLYIDTSTTSYSIYFPKDTLIDNASLKKSELQLVFFDLEKNDINQLILNFNLYYDYFLYGDTSKLIRMAIHDEEFQDSLNDFKIFVSKKYGTKKIKYLHNYIRYEIALLEQMAHQSKGEFYKTYLYNTYLKRHSINYQNDAYMQFFNLFYKEPFRIAGEEIYEKVLFAINHLNNLEKVKNALSNSTYFNSPKIAELAIIKGLYDSYSNNEVNRDNIMEMLKEIADESKVEIHQTIALDCINNLENLQKGKKCPDFHLINKKDDYINLSNCKGEYTYINFFATWNHNSLKEMEVINQLHQDYPFINFISVNLDKNENEFIKYINQNGSYKWLICQPIKREEIINDFQLDHLPSHVLIDPNNNILQYPAYPPIPLYNNQSIDVTFFNIKKYKNEKKPLNIGGKN